MSNVRNFGAVGDGVADDADAIQHAIEQGDGVIEFPRGEYRIGRTVAVDLAARGPICLDGLGGVAKLVMLGAGPALLLKASHTGTADPLGFRPEEWVRERMPTVRGLEIEGRHPQADGVRIEGVMQPTLTGLLIRQVRTGVHVTERARNLVISHCHIYHNTGVGVHFDHVNLHQAIISASHISYCRLGGVRIEGSEIRNLQITGNDIEYNNNRAHQVAGADGEATAEIYIDVGHGTVREGTISGNTLQATYSPGGANIRMIGRGADAPHKGGMWTITGNLIGSQAVNVHLSSVRGVVLSGNYLYSGHDRNLLVEDSRNIVVGANAVGHNPDYGSAELCTGVRFVDSEDCTVNGLLIENCREGRSTVEGAEHFAREGLIELVRCRRVNLSGCQVLDGAPHGVLVEDSSDVLITGCSVHDRRRPKLMQTAVRFRGAGEGSMVGMSRLDAGLQAAILADHDVRTSENLIGE